MALSGSFYSYPVKSFGVYCSWSAVQNIPGNYSDVTVTVYIQHYSISAGSRINSTIKCGGETYTYNSPSLSYPSGTPLTKTQIGSKTFRVYHDSGAAKSVVLSASWVFNGTYSGTYVGTITASSTISLDAIPQQSAIASVSVDSNNKVTVNLTRYVGSFTHTVKFVFGSYSHIVGEVGTSTSYTIPTSWFSVVPNSVTGVGSVQVTTYSGGSPVGSTVSKEFIATLPAMAVPSIGNITWTKTSSEPSSWPITKDVSKGILTMTGVSGIHGSTIVSRSLTFMGLSSNAETLTVNSIPTYGTFNAVAKVTDSRGRSATKTVAFTVADYHKPTLEVVAYRCNNTGEEDASGDSFFIKATAEVATVGNNLLDTLMLYYKKKTDSSYMGLELTSGDENILSSISSDSTWEWYVIAADWVNSSTVNGSIPTADVVFDILSNGRGIKFGGVAESEGFDTAWPFLINGIPQVDFVVEQGTSSGWTYRKWNSGIAECWGTFQRTPSSSVPWTILYYADLGSINFPFTFVDVPSLSYSLNNSSYWGNKGVTTKTNTGTLYALAPIAISTTTPCDISIVAKGKWK